MSFITGYFSYFTCCTNDAVITPCDSPDPRASRIQEIRVKHISPDSKERLQTSMHNQVDGIIPSSSFTFPNPYTPVSQLGQSFFQPVDSNSQFLAKENYRIEGDIDPQTGCGKGTITRFMGTHDEVVDQGNFKSFKLEGPEGKRTKLGLATKIKGVVSYPTEEGYFENGVLKEGKQTSVDGTYLKGIFEEDPEDGFLILRSGTFSWSNGAKECGNFKDAILREGFRIRVGPKSLEKGTFNESGILKEGLIYKQEGLYQEGTFMIKRQERELQIDSLDDGIKMQDGLVSVFKNGQEINTRPATDEEMGKRAEAQRLLEGL